MKLIQSFKALIFNVVATISAWLAGSYDLDISEENQMSIATTIMALANIGLNTNIRNPFKNKKKDKSEK